MHGRCCTAIMYSYMFGGDLHSEQSVKRVKTPANMLMQGILSSNCRCTSMHSCRCTSMHSCRCTSVSKVPDSTHVRQQHVYHLKSKQVSHGGQVQHSHLQRLLCSKMLAKSTPKRSSLPGVVTSSIQVAGFRSSGMACTPGTAS